MCGTLSGRAKWVETNAAQQERYQKEKQSALLRRHIEHAFTFTAHTPIMHANIFCIHFR